MIKPTSILSSICKDILQCVLETLRTWDDVYLGKKGYFSHDKTDSDMKRLQSIQQHSTESKSSKSLFI